MLHNFNPLESISWNKLKHHCEKCKELHIRNLFNNDANRFDKFSILHNNVLVDYSKNRITEETFSLLIELANELKLKDGIERLFKGDKINATEGRSVLHRALRNRTDEKVFSQGEDVMPAVRSVLERMKIYSQSFHNGEKKGFSGKPLKTIVNIGIGGSDLGPVMVTEALRPFWEEGISTYFVSNVDATHIAEVLHKIDVEETLFIVASKTFTTQETMRNAHTARKWFLTNGGSEESIADHFIALSTNVNGVKEFGIDESNMFEFWDWVGGRFSLSSAIGMSIVLTIGFSNFELLLEGMNDMDNHFRESPFDKNIPVLLALIGIWNVNFLGAHSEAILPYDQYLHRFAAYFQQANMESNGKSIDRNGEKVQYQTGPIIWGEPGTNGQHAFYQLIHQGTHLIPCDFIAPAISFNPLHDHHEILLSNFFAQTEALMNGKSKTEVIKEFESKGVLPENYKEIVPYKVFEGNNPTNSILVKKIDPFILGQLIAMYEHKIFVQGYLWNIYSFDQWGVELGKQLAKNILPELGNDLAIQSHDSSTNGLINQYKQFRKT